MSLAVLANVWSSVPALEPEHPNDAGNRIAILRHGPLVRNALQAAASHACEEMCRNLARTRSITITMPRKHLQSLSNLRHEANTTQPLQGHTMRLLRAFKLSSRTWPCSDFTTLTSNCCNSLGPLGLRRVGQTFWPSVSDQKPGFHRSSQVAPAWVWNSSQTDDVAGLADVSEVFSSLSHNYPQYGEKARRLAWRLAVAECLGENTRKTALLSPEPRSQEGFRFWRLLHQVCLQGAMPLQAISALLGGTSGQRCS